MQLVYDSLKSGIMCSVAPMLTVFVVASVLLVRPSVAFFRDSDVTDLQEILFADAKCVHVNSTMTVCKDTFKYMRLPNLLGDSSLFTIQLAQSFWSNVNFSCHPTAKQFICSFYTSPCDRARPYRKIAPCRSWCRQVRAACLPTLNQLNSSFASQIKCNKLQDDENCISLLQEVNSDVKVAPKRSSGNSAKQRGKGGKTAVNKPLKRRRPALANRSRTTAAPNRKETRKSRTKPIKTGVKGRKLKQGRVSQA